MKRLTWFRQIIPCLCFIGLTLLASSCGERPVSPIGSAENNVRRQAGTQQVRKTLDPSRMKLLRRKTVNALHKGHACSGSKTMFVKTDKPHNVDICHEKLEIPAGAVTQNTNISFAVADENLAMVEIGPNVSFILPVTMTLSLKVVNLVDVNMNTLAISRFDKVSNRWIDLPSTLDDKQENISAAIVKAGLYAITWNADDNAKEIIAWQGENWGGLKEKNIQHDRGGRLHFHGHEMDIPPYALPASKTMVITEIDKKQVWVDFGPSGWFYKPVKITLCFKEADLTGIDLNNLTVTWYDPATGEWIDVGGMVDAKNKTVCAEVWHFTQYSIALR